MRHAKAEPYAQTDADRPLTARGRNDAAAAGRHLAELGVVPEHALVSSAVRTRETWAEVGRACGFSGAEEISDDLYGASPDAVLESLRLVPPAVSTCIYVGHNPTAAHLAAGLDDGEAEPEALRGMLAGFPTAALAVFDVAGEWAGIGEGGARLTHFHPGRG